ncbi:hypothetical protein [Arenibacter palladensis]|uniref:hypothetical protein n=1 Tax=Arenibacter palladensis TaxID=237373 RepID=UPI0026E25EB1|nr:hypothetical protein [Arenibacter palladensis]MDO6605287.1 hypothetical protein [Arenibacter palladensis]
MNAEQLKRDHPETYNRIFNSGVTQERERVESWMEYAETNLEEVRAGIISGKSIHEDLDQFYEEVDSKLKGLGATN